MATRAGFFTGNAGRRAFGAGHLRWGGFRVGWRNASGGGGGGIRSDHCLGVACPGWLWQGGVRRVGLVFRAGGRLRTVDLQNGVSKRECMVSLSMFRLPHAGCFDFPRSAGLVGLKNAVVVVPSCTKRYNTGKESSEPSLHADLENAVRELNGNLGKWKNSSALVRLIAAVVKKGKRYVDDNLHSLNPLVKEASSVDRLMDYTSQQLTSLIHSISTMGSKCTTRLDEVMPEAGKPHRLEAMDSTGLSILVYSMGITRFGSHKCVLDIVQCATRSEHLASMSTHGLCMVLTGLERLGINESDIMLPILREAVIPPRLASMQVKDFLGLLHACGRANLHKHSQITVDRIVDSLLNRGMADISNREFINLLRGLALCKYTCADTFKRIYTEVTVQARMASYEPKDLSSLCWVMASTGLYKAKLFEELVAKYCALVDFQKQVVEYQIGIGQLVYACAEFRYRNDSIFQSLWLAMLHNPQVGPFHLVHFLWMLSISGCIQKDQYSRATTILGASHKFYSKEMHQKFLQFGEDMVLHAKVRGWKSNDNSEAYNRHPLSALPNGQHEEPIPNRFVSEIGTCLRALKIGGWYIKLLGVIKGYVFAVPRNAVLLPLQSSYYFVDLDRDQVFLKGHYAAKIEWLENIGFKVIAKRILHSISPEAAGNI